MPVVSATQNGDGDSFTQVYPVGQLVAGSLLLEHVRRQSIFPFSGRHLLPGRHFVSSHAELEVVEAQAGATAASPTAAETPRTIRKRIVPERGSMNRALAPRPNGDKGALQAPFAGPGYWQIRIGGGQGRIWKRALPARPRGAV
jgi:hypothetical protein